MPIDCQRSTSGGKGNIGKFIERDRKICAAGIPSAQPDETIADSLQHYLLKEEADALLSDAIHPPKPPRPLPPLRYPMKPDMRNAVRGDVAQLVNPSPQTKYQTLAVDMKDTAFASFWTKPLGRSKDPAPMFPAGFDIKGTTFGKKNPHSDTLYDIVMPKIPLPDKTRRAKQLAVQTDRNYCRPPYNPDLTYGYRSGIDKRGRYARCCLTYPAVRDGTSGRDVINTVLAEYQTFSKPSLAESLSPYNNINQVPSGHSFGKVDPLLSVAEVMTVCKMNPEKELFKKCFAHLNKLRKMLSTRYLPTFFRNFYLGLKFFDKDRTGWLPSDVVYNYAATKFIRFDASLLEPLLFLWSAFDGKQIKYETFVRVINYIIPSPESPKLPDFPDSCLNYVTTYMDLTAPDKPPDCSLMAGLPSGRYFDRDFPVTPEGYCKAYNALLPHETDMKACIAPSVMTLKQVSHRDMYAKRNPEVIRRVFEKIGDKFTDQEFKEIWDEAQNYHSEGWVCFETFMRALHKIRSNVI